MAMRRKDELIDTVARGRRPSTPLAVIVVVGAVVAAAAGLVTLVTLLIWSLG